MHSALGSAEPEQACSCETPDKGVQSTYSTDRLLPREGRKERYGYSIQGLNLASLSLLLSGMRQVGFKKANR